MFGRIKSSIKKHSKDIIAVFILMAISTLCVLPIAFGMVDGHDTDFHLASIYSLATSPKINLFDVKIFSSMAGNYGYGGGIFYPQFAHVVAAYIYRAMTPFCTNIYKAAAATYILLLFLSGLTIYMLLRKILKKQWLAVLCSCLYIALPYHLSDALIRDAMAETGIFVFMPVICLGLYYMTQKKYAKYLLFFVLGGVGLIYSHLVLTVFVAGFIVAYLLVNYRIYLSKKNILYLIVGAALILVISAPFWALMVQHKIAGNYVVFLDGYMINDRTNNDAHIYAWELGYPKLYYRGIIYVINWVAAALCALGLFLIKKMPKEKRKLYTYLFVANLVCCLLSIGVVNIRKWPNALHMIQFAWRLMTISCFFVAIMAGMVMELLPKRLAYIAAVLMVAFGIRDFGYVKKDISLWSGRRISMLSAVTIRYNEYYPAKTFRNLEKYGAREYDIAVMAGEADMDEYAGKIPDISFSAKTQGATLELPALYYFGYEIKAKYADGRTEKLPYRESDLGFIEFDLAQDADIAVRYTGGLIYAVSRTLSTFAVICLVCYICRCWYATKLVKDGVTYLCVYDDKAPIRRTKTRKK